MILKRKISNIGSLYTDMVSLLLSDFLIEKMYGILNKTLQWELK